MRPVLMAAAALALLLAACGTPAASSPSASALGGGSPASSPAAPATSSTRPSSSQAVVLPHDDVELEGRLPDAVDGTTLTKFSVGPESSAPTGGQAMLDVAKEIGDGSGNFGLAYATDPGDAFNLFALQVDGADSSALATQFAQMTFATTAGGKVEAAHLGGRDVVHVIDPLSEVGDVWFYADGDTLLGVQAGSPATATELLELID